MRHAYTRHDPGGTDRGWSHPHLDAVSPGLNEGSRPFGSGHVAGHEVQRRERVLERVDRLNHTGGVAVGGINHEHVHASPHQGLRPRFPILARPHRRTDS